MALYWAIGTCPFEAFDTKEISCKNRTGKNRKGVMDVKITSKGQVTIPQHIRETTGLLPDCEVEFILDGNNVIIRKASETSRRGARIVQHLRGRGTVQMKTDEIMALTRGK